MGLGTAASGGSSAATVMGYAMTLGACVYKAPVIRNILKANSTFGLSPIAVYLETSGLLAYIAYNYYRENPISSYGDVIITVIQELIIVGCILLMGGAVAEAVVVTKASSEGDKKEKDSKRDEKKGKKDDKDSKKDKKIEVIDATAQKKPLPVPQSFAHISLLFAAAVIFVIGVQYGVTTSAQTQSYVISYAIAVKVLAKVPQIIKNFTERKVGVQSLFTAGTACLGPIIKCYIAIVQVKDPLLVAGAVITLALNIVVFSQILMFRNTIQVQAAKKDKSA